MSDRFEFRVWDKKHKTYECCKRFGAYFLDQCGDLLFIEEDKEDGCWIQDSENFIVEQSTGLKDEKGNMIFEGDVVRIDSETAVVVFDNRCFWYDFDYSTLKSLSYDRIAMGCISGEIIGNIHEMEVKQ